MNISQNIKNIIFDMGEVLLPVTRSRCLNAFEKIGFDNIEQYVGISYKDGIFQQLELGLIDENEFVSQILNHCHPGTEYSKIVNIWNSFVDPIPQKRLDLILLLKKKYRIFLLSNTNIIHWKYVCEHDFSKNDKNVHDYFEKMFLSFELHVTKPDREIFEIMLNNADILPEESYFIDDAKKNCEVAESLGIHTFQSTGDDWMLLFGC